MGQRTALYEIQVAENARIVDFAGWDMPLQYSSITTEHKAVRAASGIFDVSHMGRFFISGPGSLDSINRLIVSRVNDLSLGQTRYSVVCNPQGGCKDDVLVTLLEPESFLVVVNASNREKLLAWFQEHLSGTCRLVDRTLETGMLAIQGPDSLKIMNDLFQTEFDDLPYYHTRMLAEDLYVSRTGYTGEDGFEIISTSRESSAYWRKVRELGAVPVGLGARDSLRLEMGYALYGHELNEDISPLEAGLQWVTHLEKDEFIGKEALLRQKQEGIPRRRVNFILEGSGIPRQGCALFVGDQPVGEVSSGGFSPILNKGIALGFVKNGFQNADISVEIRGKLLPVKRVKLPFVESKVAKK